MMDDDDDDDGYTGNREKRASADQSSEIRDQVSK